MPLTVAIRPCVSPSWKTMNTSKYRHTYVPLLEDSETISGGKADGKETRSRLKCSGKSFSFRNVM